LDKDVAIKLGFISIAISVISFVLVIKSDEVANSMANADFRRIIGQIEDLRLELPEVNRIMNLSTGNIRLVPNIVSKSQINTWKCQTYTDDAIDLLLKNDINPGSVSRFLNLINNYFQEILQARNILCVEAVINIVSTYKRIYGLENLFSQKTLGKFEYESRKRESIGLIRILTGIGANISIDSNFVVKYKELLVEFTKQNPDIIRWKIFFVTVNDIINLQYVCL
jgi:hypothetical protein